MDATPSSPAPLPAKNRFRFRAAKEKVRARRTFPVLTDRQRYGLSFENRFSLETSFTMTKAKNRISMTKAT